LGKRLMAEKTKIKKNINKEAGFSLVEMIVTMLVFSLVVGAAAGLFGSAIRGQSRTLSTQQLLDQISFALEYMSRALRMAKKQLNPPPDCGLSYGQNYLITLSRTLEGVPYDGRGIKFINYNDECQEFFLDQTNGSPTKGQLLESKNYASPNPLTSANFYIENFNINLIGELQNENLQPRVSLFLEIRRTGPGTQPKIKIQTTISQRRLDISE